MGIPLNLLISLLASSGNSSYTRFKASLAAVAAGTGFYAILIWLIHL